MFNSKQYCQNLTAGLLLLAAGSAHAIPVTYNFTITGTVDVLGTKTVTVTNNSGTTSTTTTETNAYGLNAGDTITAFGTFTADLGGPGSETGTVYFDLPAFNANGNTLTIDTNGTNNIQLLASQDSLYSSGGPYLTFFNGALTDFDYLKPTTPKFNSSFMNFDDMSSGSTTTETGSGKNKVTTITTYQSMLGTWSSVVVTPVPEAETYAMMLAGLGLIGFTVLRRRSNY